MDINPRAKSVEVLDGFRIKVGFRNGEIRIFDVTPLLKYPVYQPLKDSAYFARVFVSQGVIQWPNEVDISPDTLYMESQAVG